jgi:hypothetical protein
MEQRLKCGGILIRLGGLEVAGSNPVAPINAGFESIMDCEPIALTGGAFGILLRMLRESHRNDASKRQYIT